MEFHDSQTVVPATGSIKEYEYVHLNNIPNTAFFMVFHRQFSKKFNFQIVKDKTHELNSP